MTADNVLGEPTTRRWREQRWLVDNVIQSNGVDFGGRFLAGLAAAGGADAAADAAEISRRVHKYADIVPAAHAVARRREHKAQAALDGGQLVTARESSYVAACLYAYAQWPVHDSGPFNVSLNERKRANYSRYIATADHPIQEVEIPFEGSSLPGYFRLPPGYQGGRLPTIVSLTGMDGYKEKIVSLYGDPWLERGYAVLAIEGPGQFEAALRGLRVSVPSWLAAGDAIADWVLAREEVDPEQLGLVGRSFGTLFSTLIAANSAAFRAIAISAPCLEPGMQTIFNEASPAFKKRFMWMAGHLDEDDFDEFAATLTWEGATSTVTAPFLCVSGDADELSPIRFTERMVDSLPGPKTLMVYQGARHGLWDSSALALGPNYNSYMPDWMSRVFAGEQPASERIDIDWGGTAVISPL